ALPRGSAPAIHRGSWCRPWVNPSKLARGAAPSSPFRSQDAPEIARHVEREARAAGLGAHARFEPEHAEPLEPDAERHARPGRRRPWCTRHRPTGPARGHVRRDGELARRAGIGPEPEREEGEPDAPLD